MKLIIVLLLAFSLSGCATYQAVTSSPLLEASVRIAAGRVLENNPSWVLPAYRFTNIALNTIRTQEITNLGVIDDLFLQAIEEELILEEQELAIMIFTSIKESVLENLRMRQIVDPEAQKVYVLEALNWVNQVALNRL